MTESSWHIAILIPAHDEESLLPRCLHSIQRSRLHLPASVTSDLVVVSDSCTDNTSNIANFILEGSGIVVPSKFGAVGSARALAAQVALERYRGSRVRCWLANTDADCEVPAEWLNDQLALANRGAYAVAGTVDVDSFEEHEPSVKQLFRLTYVINADGTHPHVHGANFGVRADAYLGAGGWTKLTTGEDHDLWNRLQRAGYRPISDAGLQVITSGRRTGRAPAGFADALLAHNRSPR